MHGMVSLQFMLTATNIINRSAAFAISGNAAVLNDPRVLTSGNNNKSCDAVHCTVCSGV